MTCTCTARGCSNYHRSTASRYSDASGTTTTTDGQSAPRRRNAPRRRPSAAAQAAAPASAGRPETTDPDPVSPRRRAAARAAASLAAREINFTFWPSQKGYGPTDWLDRLAETATAARLTHRRRPGGQNAKQSPTRATATSSIASS